MQQIVRKTSPTLVAWTRAIVVGAAVFAGLGASGADPAYLPAVLAIIAALLAYLVPDLGVIAAVVALCIPVLAVAPVLGVAFLVVGIAGVRYLGADGGRAFLVVAVAVAGAFFGPVWASVALAGFLLGAGEGALAAAVACLAVEALGISLGRVTIGPVIVGAAAPLLDFSALPASLTDPSWLAGSLRSMDAATVNTTVDALVGVRYPLALVAQPLAWAAGAAVTGVIAREGRLRRSLPIALAGIAAGVAVPMLAAIALSGSLGAGPDAMQALTGGVASLLVGLGVAFAYERVYVTETVVEQAPAGTRSGVDTDDADVDELLTLIATAEEKLATEHTTQRAVMITDMKSFSRMTEEDGSMVTAKAIQRHRDLLLPIIERHGGSGKSTGGDGLIAAFTDSDEALRAGVEMQRTLAEYNRTHPSERELSVRIGVAHGEVVLDKRGRPFIGSAINLAARIMNLADGGQVFAEASLVRSGVAPATRLGPFELKNIAAPVEVAEITWQDGTTMADAG